MVYIANIWGILMVNVTIHGIHGSYGPCDTIIIFHIIQIYHLYTIHASSLSLLRAAMRSSEQLGHGQVSSRISPDLPMKIVIFDSKLLHFARGGKSSKPIQTNICG